MLLVLKKRPSGICYKGIHGLVCNPLAICVPHLFIFFFIRSGSSQPQASANVAVELDSIFASAKHRDSGFNRAWQDEFLAFYHRVCSEN